MLPRVLRRANYVKNNCPGWEPFRQATLDPTLVQPKSATNVGISRGIGVGNGNGNGGVIDTYKDWKIREMVKREIEKEEGDMPKIGFSGLIGILFFILFLYERR